MQSNVATMSDHLLKSENQVVQLNSTVTKLSEELHESLLVKEESHNLNISLKNLIATEKEEVVKLNKQIQFSANQIRARDASIEQLKETIKEMNRTKLPDIRNEYQKACQDRDNLITEVSDLETGMKNLKIMLDLGRERDIECKKRLEKEKIRLQKYIRYVHTRTNSVSPTNSPDAKKKSTSLSPSSSMALSSLLDVGEVESDLGDDASTNRVSSSLRNFLEVYKLYIVISIFFLLLLIF